MFKVISLKTLSGNVQYESDKLYDEINPGKVETISKEELVERFAIHSPDSLGIDWFRAEPREVGIIINDDETTSSANVKANELDLKQKMFVSETHLKIPNTELLPVKLKNNDISVLTGNRQFNIKIFNGYICNDTSIGSEGNAPILQENFIQNELRNRRYNKQPANFQLNAMGYIITSMYWRNKEFVYLIYCYSSDSFAYKRSDDFDETDNSYSAVRLDSDARYVF